MAGALSGRSAHRDEDGGVGGPHRRGVSSDEPPTMSKLLPGVTEPSARGC